MTDPLRDKLDAIWDQKEVPVIANRGSGLPLRIRLPQTIEAFSWIKRGRRNNPKWSEKYSYWKAPRAWFNVLVEQALHDFGSVYLIQTFQSQEKCARICQEAEGFDCDCSCNGENHGSGDMQGWVEISDTFATRWGPKRLGCRLLTKKPMSASQELLLLTVASA